MINSKKATANFAKKIAEKALKRDANNTTCVGVYQPKVPAKLDSFKKNSK